jgi:hypothetical protein
MRSAWSSKKPSIRTPQADEISLELNHIELRMSQPRLLRASIPL